jgi:hypothetical protein
MVFFTSKIISAVRSYAVHSDCFKFVNIPSLICRHFIDIGAQFQVIFEFFQILRTITLCLNVNILSRISELFKTARNI